MASLVPCKMCGKEISSRATRCSYCGDPVYSVSSRVFVSIILLISGLLLALLLGARMCGT